MIDVATFTVTVQWGTVPCPGNITGYTISISRMTDSSSRNISGSGMGVDVGVAVVVVAGMAIGVF